MLIEAGIDWITATTDKEEIADRVSGIVWPYLGTIVGGQEIPKTAHIRGYYGRQVPGCFMGQRNDGWMVILSSGLARAHARDVLRAGMRASRIDTQATVWFQGDTGNWIENAFEQALAWKEYKGRPPALKLIRGRDGYETTLIGSRSSEEYARVYDKWLESGLEMYRGAVRWEVENKGDTAHVVGGLMAAMSEQQATYRSFVRRWFHRRGVQVPFEGSSQIEEVQRPKRDSSLEKTHQWLRFAVAPTIARLLEVEALPPVLDAVLSKACDSATVTAIIESAARLV